MPPEGIAFELLSSDSFLEYAFLRWILTPATSLDIVGHVVPQREITVEGRRYRLDYEIVGAEKIFVVELDGFEFHGNRYAFSYDRLRQNDLHASERVVVRFSYDSIRRETRRCVEQLQAILRLDPLLRGLVLDSPTIEQPDMDPDPLFALSRPEKNKHLMMDGYFSLERFGLETRETGVHPERPCGGIATVRDAPSRRHVGE
ncbi:MAG: DUF559 domain-containing protein [Actinomycetota bacterium]